MIMMNIGAEIIYKASTDILPWTKQRPDPFRNRALRVGSRAAYLHSRRCRHECTLFAWRVPDASSLYGNPGSVHTRKIPRRKVRVFTRDWGCEVDHGSKIQSLPPYDHKLSSPASEAGGAR